MTTEELEGYEAPDDFESVRCPECRGFGWDPAVEGNSVCPLCDGEEVVCARCHQGRCVVERECVTTFHCVACDKEADEVHFMESPDGNYWVHRPPPTGDDCGPLRIVETERPTQDTEPDDRVVSLDKFREAKTEETKVARFADMDLSRFEPLENPGNHIGEMITDCEHHGRQRMVVFLPDPDHPSGFLMTPEVAKGFGCDLITLASQVERETFNPDEEDDG